MLSLLKHEGPCLTYPSRFAGEKGTQARRSYVSTVLRLENNTPARLWDGFPLLYDCRMSPQLKRLTDCHGKTPHPTSHNSFLCFTAHTFEFPIGQQSHLSPHTEDAGASPNCVTYHVNHHLCQFPSAPPHSPGSHLPLCPVLLLFSPAFPFL